MLYKEIKSGTTKEAPKVTSLLEKRVRKIEKLIKSAEFRGQAGTAISLLKEQLNIEVEDLISQL